jgi:hypothetical protein
VAACAFMMGLTAQPNVVFILADGPEYTDVGCCGSRFYETPNIDRMARAGTPVHEWLHLRPELPAHPGRPGERPVRPPDRGLYSGVDRAVRVADQAAPAGQQRRAVAQAGAT